MFIYLSKKIAIPNYTRLQCISWNKEHGWIACGGEDGLLKVLKLEVQAVKNSKVRGLAAPSNLSMNQTLEGHNGTVQVISWNEQHKKLTTSDQKGLIIVWMLYKGSWYEEMINNRNKSLVRDMQWNTDGQQICIIYEDGAVIVGSVDGNRIWGGELKTQLCKVQWSPDSKTILFATLTGEIQIYDSQGTYVSKLALKDVPGGGYNIIALQWYNGCNGYEDSDTYCLCIALDVGNIQLMRSELDTEPITFNSDMSIVEVRWNHNGSLLAVAGSQSTVEKEINLVKFYNPNGHMVRQLKVPGKKLSSVSWEGGSLRVALAVDSFIYFANIRPDYKWGYYSDTLVYAFLKPDILDTCIVFWDIKNNVRTVKYILNVISITAHGEHCVIASKSNENGKTTWTLTIFNAIGTPLDSRTIELEPVSVTVTNSCVIAANQTTLYMWQYKMNKRLAALDLAQAVNAKRKDKSERLVHVDDTPSGAGEGSMDYKILARATHDTITCIKASERLLIVARQSGVLQLYTLPRFSLDHRYQTNVTASKIAINCNATRISIINPDGLMSFFDLYLKDGESQPKFERKDVWDMRWADDNPELLAMMEKTRMYVFKGTDPEEPILSSGYICEFSGLQIRSALLDEIIRDPEQPSRENIMDLEIKSLRDTRELLDKVGIHDAYQFIEDNSHPRLWRLLAESALEQLQLEMAERAFVRSQDYQGIQLVKRLHKLDSENKQAAEIAAYQGRYEAAERLYLDMDRRDLAVQLRVKLGDWFRVVQLLKSGGAGGNDTLYQKAWNAIGDYYADRLKWSSAVSYYQQSQNMEKLVECYYLLEDYDKLSALIEQVPDNNALLENIASKCASVGMCHEASRALVKSNKVKEAVDCCVALNQWDRAVEIAHEHNMLSVDELLAKYAAHLLEKGKVLDAIELYRKANHYIDAAKLMFKLAGESSEIPSHALRTKKLYVLGAMLVEQYNTHTMTDRSALDSLVHTNSVSIEDSRLIDNAWRGAEAYHFLLLAQRQLYEGFTDAALRTSHALVDYEDVIPNETIYAIIALTATIARSFGTCSNAFIKLENVENVAARVEYEALAVEIFTRYPPRDSRTQKIECTNCEGSITDYGNTCGICDTKYPRCIVTGAPLTSVHFWQCDTCKHRAQETDIVSFSTCPLCHTLIA